MIISVASSIYYIRLIRFLLFVEKPEEGSNLTFLNLKISN
jgi:NADH:ubiquinone oxidoreductase subunit 2 (subunit N)